MSWDGCYHCVQDPNGVLVHTTVATKPEESIEEWLNIEGAMNGIANMFRGARGESRKCLDSWEGFEAQGYKVVKVKLIPEP